MFEALEHFCSDHFFEQRNCIKIPTSNLKDISLIAKEKAIQILTEEENKNIVCQKYNNFTRNKELLYPLCLTNPSYINTKKILNDNFNYKIISRYCSNSGTAIGSSYLEALIHSTNECIERDAFSIFLSKYYYLNKKSNIFSINKETLPANLKNLINEIEEEILHKVYLLDITSDIKIPTILAITESHNHVMPVFGLGTSLCSEYAISRSVSELLQTYHVTKSVLSEKSKDDIFLMYGSDDFDKRIKKGLEIQKKYPKLYKSYEFNTSSILEYIVPINYSNLPSFYSNNLSSYFNRMHNIVKESNHDIFISEQYRFKSGTSVLTVVIPGLEKFFAITHGNLVLPSERGIKCTVN